MSILEIGRRCLLGNLYSRCKDKGVTEEELMKRFKYLKENDLLDKDFNFSEFTNICEFKIKEEEKREFKQVKKIGEGSYGEVFIVEDNEGNKYAEKVYIETPELNEIDLLCKLIHPNLLHAEEIYYDKKDELHLILPLADSDLVKYLNTEKIELNDALSLMHQIISGVHFLHKNSYYHCDLKPDNILMFKHKPVVADFGFTYEHGYNIGKKCGTPTYASPQCYNRLQKSDINNQECIQIQSDIFALGCIFFHLVTSEKLIPSDIKQIDTNYSEVENKIKKFINDENESDRKEALECIYKMCRLDTNERIKTLDEVLNQEIFVNKGLSKFIEGKMKECNIKDVDYSNKYLQKVTTMMTPFAIKFFSPKMNLLDMCIFLTLIPRTINLVTDPVSYYGYALMHIASNIGSANTVFDMHEKIEKQGYAETLRKVNKIINNIIKQLNGCLTVPTVYSYTDNGLECIWYILKCINDYSFILKDPKEIRELYLEFEESDPKFKEYRFPKEQKNIVSFGMRTNNTINFRVKKLYKTDKPADIEISFEKDRPIKIL